MGKKIELNADSPAIKFLCSKDKRLARVIERVGAVSYETYDDEYDFLIGSIVGQMISGRAAESIYRRLEQACEGKITPETIDELSDDDLRRVGLSRPKIAYIRGLNEAIDSKDLDIAELRTLDDADATKRLTAIKGIGAWTATMYLIFVLDRPDIVSAYDRCFCEVYRWLYNEPSTVAAIKKRAKKWSPYASIVARYFYEALDLGLTKTERPEP